MSAARTLVLYRAAIRKRMCTNLQDMMEAYVGNLSGGSVKCSPAT